MSSIRSIRKKENLRARLKDGGLNFPNPVFLNTAKPQGPFGFRKHLVRKHAINFFIFIETQN